MSILHFSALVALACLSAFHLLLAPVMFDAWEPKVVWYVAVDFAVIAVISVNVIVARVPVSDDPTPWRLCHVVNAVNFGYALLYAIVVPDPGTVVAAFVDAALFAGAMVTQRRLTGERVRTSPLAS